MQLALMKPLVLKWAIEMYGYFLSSDVIINGFHAVGMFDTLHETN